MIFALIPDRPCGLRCMEEEVSAVFGFLAFFGLSPRTFYFMNNVAIARTSARGHTLRVGRYVTAAGTARINLDHGTILPSTFLLAYRATIEQLFDSSGSPPPLPPAPFRVYIARGVLCYSHPRHCIPAILELSGLFVFLNSCRCFSEAPVSQLSSTWLLQLDSSKVRADKLA